MYEIIKKREPEISQKANQKNIMGGGKNRSTTDKIFLLRIVTEKSRVFNRPSDTASIDLQKALDSVPRGKLWNV